MAGRDSAEKFNIAAEANKAEEKEKNKFFKNFFSPDLEWENNNDDIVDNEKVEKECNLKIQCHFMPVEYYIKRCKRTFDYIDKLLKDLYGDSKNNSNNKNQDNKDTKKK